MILRLLARRRSPVVWVHPRSSHWWDTIVPDFDAQQFVQNFRVSRESFQYICGEIRDVLEKKNTNYRLCVPVQKRVAIAIWKLSTGSEYRTISHLFGVGPSTRDYFNRKRWHSVVLQAVVDGKGLFWDVCVGFPGSVHDARILRQSHLWEILSDGQLLGQSRMTISGCDVGHYLIGDPAYPMQNWLMKPFSDTGRLTPEQHTYNYRLSSARSVVEMAFGRLKGRWRCLLKRNDCKLELGKKMALTCCVLHNICEEHGDNFTEDLPGRHVNMQPPVQALPDNGNPEGTDVRAALLQYFTN